MDGHEDPLDRLSHFVHKHLLWLMIGSYAVAACCAVARTLDPGRLGRRDRPVRVEDADQPLDADAGLPAPERGAGGPVGARSGRCSAARISWAPGLLANLLIPIAFILVVSPSDGRLAQCR